MSLLFFPVTFLNAQTGCWKQVAAGVAATVAIKNDGTLWSWGKNVNGQLGNGTSANSITSIPTQIGTSNNWKEVSCRYLSVIALKNDGTMWRWGENGYGQLGIGSTTDVFIPTQIGTSNDWKQATIGVQTITAVKNDGTLWGSGHSFLINGSFVTSHVPIQIESTSLWKEVAEGYYQRYAIKNDGTLWAWGDNNSGSLGIGATTPTYVYEATQIGTTNTWKHISSYQGHTTAIKTDNTLWAWGANGLGQLGNGLTTNSIIPIQIGSDTNWYQTEAGFNHTVAIKFDGTLWNWGENSHGCLGNGTTVNSTIPIQVSSTGNWKQSSAGHGYTTVIQNDGSLWAYGYNDSRQLGTETAGDRYLPSVLICPTSLSNTPFVKINELKIYPNPAKDFLHIQNLTDTSIDKIIILDVFGKMILEQTFKSSTIEISSLEQGLYFLQIFSDQKIKVEKFIKL